MISSLLARLTLPSVKTIYPLLLQSVQHLVYLFTPLRRLAPTLAWSPWALSLILSTSLPACLNDKLTSLLILLHCWSSYHWCTKRQLQSLIGHLHHAAKVVWPGRAFIRRMINLLHFFRRDDHPIRLSAEFKKDLHWWLQYLASWNGVCFWVYPGLRFTYKQSVLCT